MNDKSTPNQMRVLIKRMRTGNFVTETKDTTKHELSMRDMLKITRKLNEQEEIASANKETVYDQAQEEEKFRNYFRDMNVNIKFIDLEIRNDLVFWGGTIDGVIQFVYKVTADEKTSGVEFNYLEDFSPDNPNNELIAKIIKEYYNIFKKYWRENIISTKTT